MIKIIVSILLICVIIQEIQIILLRYEFAAFKKIFSDAILDGIKVKLKLPVDPEENDNDNTGA